MTDPYAGREQTKAKHALLQAYLERFAHIVGYSWPSITFVDCFCGPWESRTPDYSDTSFAIALSCFRKTREDYKPKGKELRTRFFFLEKNEKAFRELERIVQEIPETVKVVQGDFQNHVSDIIEFIRADSGTFPFVFIDPTGWTGFPLEKLRPILQLDHVEVLINHMTDQIRRFIDKENDAALRRSFIQMYGDISELERIRALIPAVGIEDASVQVYADVLRREGKFKHVGRATVLYGNKDRTYFNLIYGTRSDKGLEAFKYAEKKSMNVMESARLEVTRAKEQNEVFAFMTENAPQHSTFFVESRERRLKDVRKQILVLLEEKSRILYDELWSCALSNPLILESDLKAWLKEWRSHVQYENLPKDKRVPTCGKGIVVVWTE